MRVACKQKPAKSPPQAQLTPKLQLPTHSKWQSLVQEKSLTPAIRRQSRNISAGQEAFAIATELYCLRRWIGLSAGDANNGAAGASNDQHRAECSSRLNSRSSSRNCTPCCRS